MRRDDLRERLPRPVAVAGLAAIEREDEGPRVVAGGLAGLNILERVLDTIEAIRGRAHHELLGPLPRHLFRHLLQRGLLRDLTTNAPDMSLPVPAEGRTLQYDVVLKVFRGNYRPIDPRSPLVRCEALR